MQFEITEFTDEYADDVKDLLVTLQTHIAELDKRGVIVLKENFREEYFKFVTEEVKKQYGKIFIAVKQGRAVGVVICKIFQGGGEEEITTTCPKVGFISDLAVLKSQRRQGIGKALLAKAERFFKDCGCEYSQLEVFALNTQAYELYKNLGFEPLCIYMSKKC